MTLKLPTPRAVSVSPSDRRPLSRTAVFAAALALALLPAAVSQAQTPPAPKRVFRPIVGADGGVALPPATPPAASTAAPAAPAGDAGVKEKGKEGPDQKKRRKEYIDRIRREIRAVVPLHLLTEPDKETIRQHWRRAMRAFRIRMLAEDENDAATVARVDAFIVRLQTDLFDQLKAHHPGAKPAAGKDGGK